MAIILEDGFWNNWGLGWETALELNLPKFKQTELNELAADVMKAYPGVYCSIGPSMTSAVYEIGLSKAVGKNIVYSNNKVTESELHSNSNPVSVIVKAIDLALKNLEAAELKKIEAQKLVQTQGYAPVYFEPKYCYASWTPDDYSVKWTGFTPATEQAAQTTTHTPSGIYSTNPAPMKISYESIFGESKAAPKIESLTDMYNAPPKGAKKVAPKAKLTAVDLANLKKQTAMGIPNNLTLAKAKKLHAKLSELWGENWLEEVEITEEVKEKVKGILKEIKAEKLLKPAVKVDFKSYADEFFKESPLLSYIKAKGIGSELKGKVESPLKYELAEKSEKD